VITVDPFDVAIRTQSCHLQQYSSRCWKPSRRLREVITMELILSRLPNKGGTRLARKAQFQLARIALTKSYAACFYVV
jgi:hypothetical protein